MSEVAVDLHVVTGDVSKFQSYIGEPDRWTMSGEDKRTFLRFFLIYTHRAGAKRRLKVRAIFNSASQISSITDKNVHGD